VAAPHFWVKYQGPDGSAASRQIVRELVRFETEAAAFSQMLPEHGQREGRVSSLHPSIQRPDGSRAPMRASLASLFVLAAVVFVVGLEATRCLSVMVA
jgi:hypothetical protein